MVMTGFEPAKGLRPPDVSVVALSLAHLSQAQRVNYNI